MEAFAKPRHTFSFSAGALCLDFCNTVGGRHQVEVAHEKLKTNHLLSEEGRFDSRDYLREYDDLIEWGKQAGLLATENVERLMTEAANRPQAAATVLAQAITLREGIYRLFSAIADDQTPRPEDLAVLNGALPTALAQQRVIATDDGFMWTWTIPPQALDPMLWPVARSAADLLTSPELVRVRECAGETCGWLFMDMSKNHTRRWCSMDDCGNRAKAKRHYRRTKQRTGV
jgi:predicted RNA-binding Zn ribbon-like protein